MPNFMRVGLLCLLGFARVGAYMVSVTANGAIVRESVQGGPSRSKAELETMLQIAVGGAIAANASYVLIGGTALGVYREGGLIDGDDDIDIAVPLSQVEDLKKSFHAMNATWRTPDKRNGDAGFMVYPLHPWLYPISFWAFTPSKSGEYMCFPCPADFGPTCYARTAFPTKTLLPPRLVPTHVTDRLTYSQLPVPGEPELFLETCYGKDFRTPKSHYKEPLSAANARFDAHCL